MKEILKETEVQNTVSDADCLSGKRYRQDTIIEYSNETTETIIGDLAECTGSTVEDAVRLVQQLCDGSNSNSLTTEGFSHRLHWQPNRNRTKESSRN